MSEHTAKKEDGRISRLNLVRTGATGVSNLKMPRRGRVELEIESIIPDPANERKTFRGIDDLAASIRQVGIVEPPTVVPLEDGRYMLTTGERRWRAAKKAGLKRIHVIIGDPEDERRRRVKSLISNVQREDLSAVELAYAIQEMKEENPDVKTNRDIAGLVGKSEQWVGAILKVLHLPEELQKEIRAADRTVPYESVIQIARINDATDQRKLLDSVLSGASVREVREQAKSTKSIAKPEVQGREESKQKIPTSKGWVIIHCDTKSAKKDDYVTALTEALKAISAMDI